MCLRSVEYWYFLSLIKLNKSKDKIDDTVKDVNVER